MAKIEITAFENGPYVIKGSATYVDEEGNEQTTPGKSFALCRCGQSANKPFCDGAHRECKFEGSQTVLTLDANE